MRTVNGPSEMPESIGGVSNDERVAVIQKDSTTGAARVCTTDFVEYGKLLKRCAEHPEAWKAVGCDVCEEQPQVGYFSCPNRLIRYGVLPGGNRFTDEQRAAAGERLKAAREAKAKKGG